ncbi:ATP-binding protein [Lysinibacillus antri]|uniref:Transcriptional regulator n=1 Tax=Lysinibacillus antri TaxID=2498145 RepID=A0A432LF72_9BACI|nr:ATP-binding protein [Lysinibacillus antri]RUL54644.1 transcriptional regulator [Lysinibacillus antri]
MNKNVHHPPDYSSVPQDNLILEHYGINELNFESIKRYREKFSASKPDHPWNGLEMKDFLYKIGAWGKVRNTNKEGLTLAGLLMFSEERIITEVLPQYFIEYRENLGETTDEAWSKRFTSQDGTWSGNVFDFYFKTSTDLVGSFDSLYKRSNSTQSDETAIKACLQESLINALVHSDYYGEGGVVIEKESTLFRFSNPGLLRISVEQALEGNISNLRNPNLFKMFILIGLCKRTGSGLKSIETAWKYYGDDAFDLTQDPESERTILTLHVNLNVTEEQEQEHFEEITESDLFLFPEEEHHEPLMANFDVLENSVNKETSSYNNEGNTIDSEINSVNKESDSYNKSVDSINSEINSCNNGVNSLNSETNSCNNEVDSYNKEALPFDRLDSILNSYNSEMLATNDEKIEMAGNALITETEEEEINVSSPKEVEEKLWEISELARRKKRLSPSVMEEIIMKLCTQRPLMIRELADLLGRTPDGLRNNYLAKLLDKGKVRLKYPNQINHPKQAYIAVEKQN